MDFVTISLGSIITAFLIFAGVLVVSIFATALTGYVFPEAPRRMIALIASGAFPVLLVLLVVAASFHEVRSGLDDTRLTSLVTFGVGSLLSLVAAWPLAFKITSRLFLI